jgi:DNA-binding CsgD family transcriptional regulator
MIARPFTPEEFLGGEEAFLAHPVYTQVFRPFGLRYLACSLLYFEEHWGAAFSMARGAAQGPYLADEMADLEQTLQHLSRAVSLRYALAAAERTSRILAETLNAFDRAAIVVSSDGTLRFANRLGEALLAKADGLRAEAGRVKPVARDEARTFQSLVAGCTMAGGPGPRAGGLMRIARASGRPLQLVVSPLASSFGSDVESGLALVLVADPDRPPPEPRRLVAAHGLTGAEAAVAARLLIGETPADAAAALGLSITTVRFHLRNLKAKTGTHRQAELLLLLRETL